MELDVLDAMDEVELEEDADEDENLDVDSVCEDDDMELDDDRVNNGTALSVLVVEDDFFVLDLVVVVVGIDV